MGLTVRPVEDGHDLAAFVDLPWRIYREYPFWIPPLKREVRELLDPLRNPFWQHAERQLFLAWGTGPEPVGRIAAILDRHHDEVHGERAGFFGFFECLLDPDAAEALFEVAGAWCRARGARFLRGPASPSANDEYGFLLQGFSSYPTIMMPYTPPYYLEYADRSGFAKAMDLHCYLKPAQSGFPDRIERLMQRQRRRSRFTLRPFDPRHFDRDVAILKEVYNEGWERNWGFVPLTEAEMDLAARKLRDFYDPGMVVIGEHEGRPAGVCITVPNANEVLRHLNGRLGPIEALKFLRHRRRIRGTRAMIGGVKPAYRQTGLIAELIYETIRRGFGRYEWCEIGWTLEENTDINRLAVEFGSMLYKKYRVYQKPLSSAEAS